MNEELRIGKSKAKRKSFCFACIFSLISLSAFAISKEDFSLEIEPEIGLRRGITGEYVFEDVDGSSEKLSYLEWEEKNIYPIGLRLSGGIKNLFASVYLGSAFTGFRCGDMYDSDWMNHLGYKTTYSISENTLDSYLDFNLSLKYNFYPLHSLSVSPVSEFGYFKIKFKARNGYGWYGHSLNVPWYDPQAIYYESGELNGIDYTQQTYSIFMGFDVSYTPIEKLHLNLCFLLSPYTYYYNTDIHWRNQSSTYGDEYVDAIDSFFRRIKGKFSVYYDLTQRISLGAGVQLYYAFTSKGDNYSKSTSKSSYTKNISGQGGADGKYFNISLSAKFKVL